LDLLPKEATTTPADNSCVWVVYEFSDNFSQTLNIYGIFTSEEKANDAVEYAENAYNLALSVKEIPMDKSYFDVTLF
jgi:hypothetical protein